MDHFNIQDQEEPKTRARGRSIHEKEVSCSFEQTEYDKMLLEIVPHPEEARHTVSFSTWFFRVVESFGPFDPTSLGIRLWNFVIFCWVIYNAVSSNSQTLLIVKWTIPVLWGFRDFWQVIIKILKTESSSEGRTFVQLPGVVLIFGLYWRCFLFC
jgi:hypothetical protein